MRILILDTHYPAFLSDHYARDPDRAHRSYDAQWCELMGTFFGTSDAYSHAFRTLGHASQELVVNCQPLQERWADEHDPHRLGIGPRRDHHVRRRRTLRSI